MRETAGCLVCGGRKYSVFLDQKDSLYFQRRIVRCGDCGLLYVNPQPEERELDALYNELSNGSRAMFWDRSRKDYVVREGMAAEEKSEGPGPVERRAKLRVKIIKKLAPPPLNALDIGCGEGRFLLAAKEAGYRGEGIEISKSCAEAARQRTGFEVFSGALEEYAEGAARGKFDVITMWDVVEHLLDPAAALRKISALHARGGVLGISTVNLMNYRYLRYGTRWRGFRESQEHIIFFSRRTLSMLLDRCGYTTVRVVTRMIPAFHLKWLNWFGMGNVLEVYARKNENV